MIDLAGDEIFKSSDITADLINVTDRAATFAGAERYFNEISQLRAGEIYVSEVTGVYRSTHLIGPYSKARTDEAGIDFAPQDSAYAGIENPVGKPFEGIIRYVTPIFENGVKQVPHHGA